jgi:hypothetical protein
MYTVSRFRIPLILQVVVFVIPMTIYVIGDWLGAGSQWVFFRYIKYQEHGSIIFLPGEIGLILSGILTGKSAFASVLWAAGVILVVAATVVIVYGTIKPDPGMIKKGAFVNLGGAVLFLLSVFRQYGISLHGPAGLAIPFGIIVLFVIAYSQYRISCMKGEEPDNDNA